MKPVPLPKIEKRNGPGQPEIWVQFQPEERAIRVRPDHWIGFDFDGVLSVPDPSKPYRLDDLGLPVKETVNAARALLDAGIVVKVFTARTCDAHMIPKIQDWTEANGLGRLEVTNVKDYGLVRFYDDRAIQVRRAYYEVAD